MATHLMMNEQVSFDLIPCNMPEREGLKKARVPYMRTAHFTLCHSRQSDSECRINCYFPVRRMVLDKLQERRMLDDSLDLPLRTCKNAAKKQNEVLCSQVQP